MRNEKATEKVRVATLAELDALVGQHLVGETPEVHWEDAQTHFQFTSVEEALEMLHDPLFRDYSRDPEGKPTVLTEVKQYRRYSQDLNATWNAVEQLSASGRALEVRREGSRWIAAFSGAAPVEAPTAPLAICVAALRVKGIPLEIDRRVFDAAQNDNGPCLSGAGAQL